MMRKNILDSIHKDTAFSAIVGVIVMIAIVVAIAATIYVATSGLSTKNSEQSNNIAFNIDEVNNKFIVVSSLVKANWSSMSMKVNNPTWVSVNGNFAQVTTDYQKVSTLFNISSMISAGDTFYVSSNSTGEKIFTFNYEEKNAVAAIVTLNSK